MCRLIFSTILSVFEAFFREFKEGSGILAVDGWNESLLVNLRYFHVTKLVSDTLP